jgi:flagellar hook-length control protein FliK
VFSRLLEGLRRNFKTGPQGSGQTTDPEGEPSIRGEAPPADGETVPIKKTNPRGVKTSLFYRGDEGNLKKETPESAEEADLPGEKASKIPRGKTEEGQEAAVEEAASLLVPKDGTGVSLPQKTAPEGSPRAFSDASAAEETALSGEAGRPETQNRVNSVGVPQEDHPKDRRTGEILRGLAELSRGFSPEREPEAARLVRAPEKSPQDTEKAGRTNPRRNDPASGAKRRERGGVEVRDLRTGLTPEVPVNRVPAFAGEAAGGIREVELRVELPGNSRSSGEGLSAGGLSPSRAFEEVLAGELRGGLGDDIVRQASIILKDGGAGIIRLALKPESLGNVKIRLEMAENKIAGRIIVESNEALRAFEREIQSLEQAFKDSGFNGASIEMSVSSDNGGNRGNRQGKGEEASPFFSERLHLAASGYESAGDLPVLTGNSGASSALGPVNMLV